MYPAQSQKGFALITVVVIITAVLSAGVLLSVKYFSDNKSISLPINNAQPQNSPATTLQSVDCGVECEQKIDQKIAESKKDILSQVQNALNQKNIGVQVLSSPSPSANFPKEFYVNFGLDAQTRNRNWEDIKASELIFNTNNYPGASAFYYQVFLQSDAPDRPVYTRIVNANTGLTIPGSEMEYTGVDTAFKENRLTLPSGDLKLKVQIKVLDLNLGIVRSPRIKIVY